MEEVISTEEINFSNDEIKTYLERMDTKNSFKVDQLVFYPYFFFEYDVDKKSFFHPIGTMGCAVDGINGVSAIIDKMPDFSEKTIPSRDIIQNKLSLMKAKAIAEPFLYDSISYKMKVLSMPAINLSKQEIFYRPYWIAEGGMYVSNSFSLTVDAVTGKYHPL